MLEDPAFWVLIALIIFFAIVIYIKAPRMVTGALEVGVKGWVAFDKSGLAVTPDGTLLGNQPYRKDIRVWAGFFGEYRFRAWLALFGSVGYVADFTDFVYLGVQPLVTPNANYQTFQAWLGLRVFY